MVSKILIFCLLAAAVVSSPVEPLEEEEDLPVYTEKVLPNKPTQVPKFGAKKATTSPRKVPEKQLPLDNRRPYEPPAHTTSAPKVLLKSTKPIRNNARPVRRINRIPLTPSTGYNEIKPTSNYDYETLSPSFIAAKGLGVEYAPDDDEHLPHEDSIDDYPLDRIEHQTNTAPELSRREESAPPRPVIHQSNSVPERIQHHSSGDIGSASGNAPELQYAVAPQRFGSAPAEIRDIPDYGYADNSYDENPQPYIFGYELQDEYGSKQSRKEQGDDYGNKRGSYGYTDGHGIYRQVEYIADEHGFRAVVKTNEPGTDNQNPADVEMHSEANHY